MPWRNIEDKRANGRAWAHRLQARWRAAGCCTRCGTPVRRFVTCFECRAKHVQNVLASRRRVRARQAALAEGA